MAPTDAGEQLLASLPPTLAETARTLTQIAGAQRHPVGRIRLLVPRLAAKTVSVLKLGGFVRTYRDVVRVRKPAVRDEARFWVQCGSIGGTA